MNPLYNALQGHSEPLSPQMNNLSPNPRNGLCGLVERARGMMQNPMNAVRQIIPGLPEQIASDPNQIIGWLQQTGRVTPQQIQAAQQLQQMMPK